MSCPIIVLDQKHLRWSFDDRNPCIKVARYGWPREQRVFPAPGYAHSEALTRETAELVESRFPLLDPPHIYLMPFDDVGRCNGQTQYDENWYQKDANGHSVRHHWIYLFGKVIPPHPAMTRYLVAHEYGHVVEDVISCSMYKNDDPDAALMKDYAEMRGYCTDIEGYGPGTWHANIAEIFANDFRILVCGVETEFWPHPCPHPEDVPGLRDWWYRAELWQRELVKAKV
jgi:hypothetical protein